MVNHKLSRAVRLALTTAAATSTVYSSVAVGQDQQAEQGALEQVIVTGSRIPQPNLTSISPVTSVRAEEVKLEGVTRVEDLVNNLPQAFADFGGNLSNGATGAATVNLRDLGAQRTLVLVNGRRLMPGDPTQNGNAAPDLNQIPTALIQRIDVLTGGASAVYGADAVAGVVNFIMNDKFEGVRLDGQYSLYQHNNSSPINQLVADRGFSTPASSVDDGYTRDITFLAGINTEDQRGNATIYVGYRGLGGVTQDQRDYSACSLGSSNTAGTTSNFTCAGSGTTAPARFTTYDPNDPNNFIPTGDWALGAGNVLVPFAAANQFNFAPFNYYQRPDDRKTAGLFAHYDLSDKARVYSEFMFMDDRTQAQIAPSGAFLGSGPGQPPFFGRYLVNCDNPYLSPSELTAICGGSTTAGDKFLDIGRRNVEGGARTDDLRHTSFRAVVGAKGDIASGWTYDLYGLYGTTVLSENYLNDVSKTRLGKALTAVTDANGNVVCRVNADADSSNDDPNCVPYNIFQSNGVTSQAVGYLQVPGFQEGSTTEQVFSAAVTGDLGRNGVHTPWAQDGLGTAFGVEWRQEESELKADSAFQTNDLAGQGAPILNTTGKFNVREIFAELRLPLAEEKSFAKSLSVEAGYRYSDYSLGFSTNTYKFGADWAPLDDIRLRASFQRAVRAPNIQELFLQERVQLDGVTDPCTIDPTVPGSTPEATAAQCANTGVTAAQYGNIIGNPAAQYNGLVGGSPNLEPESSDTLSFGFVFTPRFVERLSLAVDYYDIKVDKIIGSVGADFILGQCLDNGDPTYCSLVHRSPGTGSLWLGTAGYVADPIINTGSLQTKGIDLEADYSFPLGDRYGRVAINLIGTYVDELVTQPLTGSATYDCVGLYGTVCGTPVPKWRHKARFTWSTPFKLDASLSWRYIEAVNLDTTSSNPLLAGPVRLSDKTLGSRSYIDLTVGYTFDKMSVFNKLNLRLGVNNLLDKDPPVLGASSLLPTLGSGNTFPQVYDVMGRYVFFGATADF